MQINDIEFEEVEVDMEKTETPTFAPMLTSIEAKMLAIQLELKAPKNQYNQFGKFKYRSCEDILEGVKPLLGKHNVMLIIQDDIEQIGERFYVKSTVTAKDIEGGGVVATHAYAREAASEKGFDTAQLTGAASSYSRKYALNAMFCIDDVKDPDANENGPQTAKNRPKETPPEHVRNAQRQKPNPKPPMRAKSPLDNAKQRAWAAVKAYHAGDEIEARRAVEECKQFDDYEETPEFWSRVAEDYEAATR